MRQTKPSGQSFGAADHGVDWAIKEIGGRLRNGQAFLGDDRVELLPYANPPSGDDYSITFGKSVIQVRANTAVGAIGGLFKLQEIVESGKRADFASKLAFRTRNYKHEVGLDVHNARSVVNYTDATWEALCRQLVKHQFNGLVLYCAGHPFEFLLDYKEFPEAASIPEADRTAARQALNRGLAIAHKYGLTTFMQHYVNHFTRELAEHYKIPTTGRLAAVEHPEIDRYTAWCYRALFEQVPDLDGMYFNFESTPSATKHILNTAIAEFNKMDRKPICIYRLWNFTDIEGMKTLRETYRGRTVVSHKVSDTNDVYYLPAADSRVMDWKKAIGKDLEWMYCMGPCHNCGTNLCKQLWGDYDFAYDLLADAKAKGCDSIGFHTIFEFFSPDLPKSKAFGNVEKDMVKFNYLHLRAVVDFFNGRRLTKAQQADALADRVGVDRKAGPALREAVVSSSQPVLLTYQQFCYGSAHEGYLNPGRYSHIQDPFFYHPATEHNDQASRAMWQVRTNSPWVQKKIDVKVADDNLLQYIIDYVDPSKPKATRNPQKLADLIRKNIDSSTEALAQIRKLAGEDVAKAMQPHLALNAQMGEYVEREVRAAIAMYSIYFATSKTQVVSSLKKGLEQLEGLRPMVAKDNARNLRVMNRIVMFDGLNPEVEIAAVQEALKLVQATDFPMDAYADYLASRREYNEARRIIRPVRSHDRRTVSYAVKQFKASIAKAEESLAKLTDQKHAALADNVRTWKHFVENELARTKPPQAAVSKDGESQFFSLQHDDCLRGGYNFIEDFIGFFKKGNYLQPAGISFRASYNDKELVLTLREDGVDTQQRRGQWDRYKTEGSCQFVQQVYVDAGCGRDEDGAVGPKRFIVWPMGSSVTAGRAPHAKARTEFSCDATAWETTVYIPFSLIGKKPAKGEVWGLNILSNPAITKNYQYTWGPQYDGKSAALFGKVKFE